METCLPICELEFRVTTPSTRGSMLFNPEAIGGTPVPAFTAGLGISNVNAMFRNTNLTSNIPYVLTRASYLSPVYDLLGSCFVRWKVNKLKFHYTPQSSTQVNGRAVFCFAEDPFHPLLYQLPFSAGGNVTEEFVAFGTAPTQPQMLAFADSMAFAPWLPWTMDVSDRVKQNELYTQWVGEEVTVISITPFSVMGGDPAGLSSSIRQSMLGAIGCQALTTESSDFTGGIIWMELDLDLIEFCPISLTTTAPPTGPPAPIMGPRAPLKKRNPDSLKGKDDTADVENCDKCLCKTDEQISVCGSSECEHCVSPARAPNGGPCSLDVRPEGSRAFSRVYTLEEVQNLLGHIGDTPSGKEPGASKDTRQDPCEGS